ncbi:S1 RNA-binding domain-containing protein [Kitasatospora sp. NPDC096147]|uniref:S1 RNA-binding domain-containing protein n=1 Tax=Kitasatospora sp. NPDC096147 TaxID=3364093 RepID=UPI00381A6CD9
MALHVQRLTPVSGGRLDHRERLRFAEAAAEVVAGAARAAGVTEWVIDNPMLGGFFSFRAGRSRAERRLAELLPEGPPGFHDGARVPLATGVGLLRSVLAREGPWCRLSGSGGFFVHVGEEDDLYMGGERPFVVGSSELLAVPVPASPYRPELDVPADEPVSDDAWWRRLGELVAGAGAVLVEERWAGNARRWHRPADAGEVAALRGVLTPRARLWVWPDLSEDIAAVRTAVLGCGERLELLVQRWPDGRFAPERIAEAWMGRDDLSHPTISDGPGRRAALVPLGPGGPAPLMAGQLPDPDGVLRARWRTDSTRADRVRSLLGAVREGDLVTGTVVSGLDDIGVHVDLELGDGPEGLGRGLGFLRVPEMSWERFDSVDEIAPVGRRIRAEVLHVDLEREQVALSVKALTPDPWRLPGRLPPVGATVQGVVTYLVPFGAFVRVAEGVEGMLHVSELTGPDGLPPGHPEEVLTVGEELAVLLSDLDLDRRRIVLASPEHPRAEPR